MARLATIGAETSVGATTTLLHGKCTLETPSTVHIHGLGATKRGLVARRGGRKGWGTWREARRRLGWRLGARAGSRSLVLLDRDGNCHVSMEGRGEGATSGKLKPNRLL